ncbi:unnamed protein product [Ixodes persulcatus]
MLLGLHILWRCRMAVRHADLHVQRASIFFFFDTFVSSKKCIRPSNLASSGCHSSRSSLR